jgi:hypothetical protein
VRNNVQHKQANFTTARVAVLIYLADCRTVHYVPQDNTGGGVKGENIKRALWITCSAVSVTALRYYTF